MLAARWQSDRRLTVLETRQHHSKIRLTGNQRLVWIAASAQTEGKSQHQNSSGTNSDAAQNTDSARQLLQAAAAVAGASRRQDTNVLFASMNILL